MFCWAARSSILQSENFVNWAVVPSFCLVIYRLLICVLPAAEYTRARDDDEETKFPRAVEESYSVFLWTVKNASLLNIDPSNIFIGWTSQLWILRSKWSSSWRLLWSGNHNCRWNERLLSSVWIYIFQCVSWQETEMQRWNLLDRFSSTLFLFQPAKLLPTFDWAGDLNGLLSCVNCSKRRICKLKRRCTQSMENLSEKGRRSVESIFHSLSCKDTERTSKGTHHNWRAWSNKWRWHSICCQTEERWWVSDWQFAVVNFFFRSESCVRELHGDAPRTLSLWSSVSNGEFHDTVASSHIYSQLRVSMWKNSQMQVMTFANEMSASTRWSTAIQSHCGFIVESLVL